jgi:hypothetical protein
MPTEEFTVDTLIAKIKDKSDKVRSEGWTNAGKVGADAVKPLAAVTISGDSDLEVARAAKHALWQIVHDAWRSDSNGNRKAVAVQLHGLLTDDWPDAFRREVLWMLSEIGGDSSVEHIAAVIKNTELLDDARCALERIPGDASLEALKAALDVVPNDYKLNIAHSLRVRGFEPGREKYPSQRLVPTKQTAVRPGGRK